MSPDYHLRFIDSIEIRSLECGAQAWRIGIVILAERPGRATVSRARSRAASEIRVASKCQSISIGHADSNGNRRECKYVLLSDVRVDARVSA